MRVINYKQAVNNIVVNDEVYNQCISRATTCILGAKDGIALAYKTESDIYNRKAANWTRKAAQRAQVIRAQF